MIIKPIFGHMSEFICAKLRQRWSKFGNKNPEIRRRSLDVGYKKNISGGTYTVVTRKFP